MLALRTRRPCTGVKIPKTRKRGFRGRKSPIPHQPGKGQFQSENPFFYCGALFHSTDFSGVAPANQTKESEVRELSGKESGTGSGTPMCLEMLYRIS